MVVNIIPDNRRAFMRICIFVLLLNIVSILLAQDKPDSKASLDMKNEERHWVLVWNDEFDYEGLPDPYKWSYETGGGGWGNEDKTYYTYGRKENVYVKDGVLTIKAQKEKYKGYKYTSARLHTRNKGSWKYGRIEIKAKVSAGRGILHSIWMLPSDNYYGVWPFSGEIDIMEYVGFEECMIYSSVHTGAYNHKNDTHKYDSYFLDYAKDLFYIYSIEWTPEYIDFFVNGKKFFTFYKESDSVDVWPFDNEFYLLLCTNVGGIWAGLNDIDETIFPVELKIDWVRVYQNELKQLEYAIKKEETAHGEVKYIPDIALYQNNQEVTVLAKPDDGYVFDRWEGSVQGNNNPLVFNINRNMKINPIFKKKGEILENSDFSMGKRKWILQFFNHAEADYNPNDNNLDIVVHKTGKKPWEIQLNQFEIPLEKGKKYKLSVTLKSVKRRWINFGISNNITPFKPYIFHRIFVNKKMRTYEIKFKMRSDNDFHSRFFMDLGKNSSQVNVESISLQEID